jgi:hypothetical protein
MNICATSIHVSGSESRRRGPDVAPKVNERNGDYRQLGVSGCRHLAVQIVNDKTGRKDRA